MSRYTNTERAERFGSWLDGYGEDLNGSEEQVIDLLADMMHHVGLRSDLPPFDAMLDMARMHYEAETAEES